MQMKGWVDQQKKEKDTKVKQEKDEVAAYD